jgi:acetolactate synthase I/II/III large subunit
MNGAQRIARRLAAAGIRNAFGIPGGEVLALVEAMNEAGIATHLTRHENAAGFMAEGMWHASGAPGLFYATLGPGVANAVNVVANAQQDRVPLVFLTGCVDHAEAESYTHQVFDHQALLRPIVKASFRATIETADLVVDKALAIALSGRPGPVHIDVPIGVAEGEAGEAPLTVSSSAGPAAPAPGPMLDSARRALADARKPLIVAGLDVVNQGAGDALRIFAERFQAPIITTYKAKGVVSDDNPLVVAGAGLSPKADRLLLPLLAEADLIILAGYDPIEMRINWRHPWPDGKPVIEISAEALPHGMHHVTHRFIGDVAAGLAAIADAPPTDAPVSRRNWAAKAKSAVAEAFAPVRPWGPEVVFKAIENALPVDTVATADSGAHRILLSQLWTSRFARSLLQSSGLCTMGCAVPIAAGFKLARPATPVVAFVGDAGLEMGLGELAAIRDLKAPVIVCVLVDESLALIEMKQRATQRPPSAVEFGGTDFPAVARAMGGYGVWIDDAATLMREARAASRRDTFTILACRIGKRAYDGLI